MGGHLSCMKKHEAPPKITDVFRLSTMQIGQLSQTKVEPKRVMSVDSMNPGESIENAVDWSGVVKKYRFLTNTYPPKLEGEEYDEDERADTKRAHGSSYYIKSP
ncbi:unnamed protein product [Allacma fusca]|uniref:Uncharacterized protein n=1 Tax=Allacma fusca TaxID=39272 RepID=A0A8J2K5L6_9HEXA|nr:unnamed protein product [Allacma fusca]